MPSILVNIFIGFTCQSAERIKIDRQGAGLYDVNEFPVKLSFTVKSSLFGWYILSAVAGLAAIGSTFYIRMAIDQKIPGFLAHYGPGYYLLLFGGIALVVAAIIGCVFKAARKAK